MKIKLMKDHKHHGVKYKAGEEIEVTKEEYDFLVNVYVADRKQVIEKAQKIEKTLKGDSK